MRGPIEPSYLAKLRRGDKHIKELERVIYRYRSRHPYEARGGKAERDAWRLHFTEYPENTDIPIVAADGIYNIRSALDHLRGALVPKKREHKGYFPIYFPGRLGRPHPGRG